ncbi:MAG: hypothetical protein H6625_04830 [Bdellovibrionaceae bacterium]|nr:hypothetical protein [Pseudobdellovibrionaceae bacterium]
MNKVYLLFAVAGVLLGQQSWAAEVTKKPSSCVENLNQEITPQMKRARDLYIALTGSPIPFCDERIERMTIYLAAGRARDAVRVAIADPDFYNIKIREMASRICTFENSPRTSVNDCIATYVGAIRDGIDARQLLTGNFWYRIDEKKAPQATASNLVNNILKNGNHYNQIDDLELSMFHVLKRVDGQMIIDPTNNNNAIAAQDPAGVITSRAWMMAHAIAGTNRRLVEKSFEQFLCSPIREWADNTMPDTYVGRDVTRTPGDDPNKYLVTCKGCHAPMDSMRSVFAHVDWNENNGGFYRYNPTQVTPKMNRNTNETPQLTYLISGDTFDNYATQGANAARFGWRGPTQGEGMKAFAGMLANSEQYNRCLTTHVFRTVCGRKPEAELKQIIDTYARDFDQKDNHDVRVLFERIALRPECTGDGNQ